MDIEEFRLLCRVVVLLIAILMIGLFISCGVSTSNNISVDTDDIQYVKDERTGLCFAFVASSKAMSTSAEGLGFTCVLCDSIPEVKAKKQDSYQNVQ